MDKWKDSELEKMKVIIIIIIIIIIIMTLCLGGREQKGQTVFR